MRMANMPQQSQLPQTSKVVVSRMVFNADMTGPQSTLHADPISPCWLVIAAAKPMLPSQWDEMTRSDFTASDIVSAQLLGTQLQLGASTHVLTTGSTQERQTGPA